jgi:spore germination protein GerM
LSSGCRLQQGPLRVRGKKGRGRTAGRALAAVTASLALAGCGLGAQSAPEPLSPPPTTPHQLVGRTSQPGTAPAGIVPALVTIFLEGPGEHLVPVRSEVPWPATMAALLGRLAAGPTASESSRGLVSPASSVGPFGVGAVHDGVVPVDLPESFENLGGEDQTMAAAQIVFTVTTFPGVKGVRFLIGGQAAQVPNGNGSLTAGPSTRKDYGGLAY